MPDQTHEWVQPKNFTSPLRQFYNQSQQLAIFENLTNICELERICKDVELNKTSYTYSCFEQDPTFAILTLFFILNTGHMVFNAFFHYSRCRSLTHAFLWMTLGFYLLILPPLDIFFLWGIFCLLMGCSSMWGSGMREKSSYSILDSFHFVPCLNYPGSCRDNNNEIQIHIF